MNLEETTGCFDIGSDLIAGCGVWGNGCTNRNTTVLGDLAGHKPNTPDVDIPMFLGKGQFIGKILPNNVPIQECDRAFADFEHFGIKHAGNG